MMTPQEIRTVTFDKVMRGYRAEDVDAFLQQVSQEMERLVNESAEKDKKLYILAEKIEEYRKDEDTLKTALLNAQRMGENVIREAKQKAESLMRESSIRSDTLIRMANEQVEEQQAELERVKAEIASFKNQVLGMYKAHIELLSQLPESEDVEVAEEHGQVEEPTVEMPQQPEEEQLQENADVDVQEIECSTEEDTQNDEPEMMSFPDLANLYGNVDTESEQKLEQENQEELGFNGDSFLEIMERSSEQQSAQPAQSADPLEAFQGFKGIKFSD